MSTVDNHPRVGIRQLDEARTRGRYLSGLAVDFLGNVLEGRMQEGRLLLGNLDLTAPSQRTLGEDQPAALYVRPDELEIKTMGSQACALRLCT
jgi:CysA C-terminal regulatory domain